MKAAKIIIAVGVLSLAVTAAASEEQNKHLESSVAVKKMEDFTDPGDGQIYPTVQIGEQVWISCVQNGRVLCLPG